MTTTSCDHDKVYTHAEPIEPKRWPWICKRCGRKGKDVAVVPDAGQIQPDLFQELIESHRPG